MNKELTFHEMLISSKITEVINPNRNLYLTDCPFCKKHSFTFTSTHNHCKCFNPECLYANDKKGLYVDLLNSKNNTIQ